MTKGPLLSLEDAEAQFSLRAAPNPMSQPRWTLGRFRGQPVNPRIQKNAEQLGIDFFVAHAELQNIQRAIGGNRAFVRTVRRGERVENVAYRHHLRLHRNLPRYEPERIALAVELLMVRAAIAGMARNSCVHGICARKLKLCTTCDSIWRRSSSSRLPRGMDKKRTSSEDKYGRSVLRGSR